VGTGASLAGLGYPVLCNGANLAFRKKSFFEVGGYTDSLHTPSGDDVLLLQKMVRRGSKILFVADQHAIVSTEPLRDFSELFNQRIRWAGKWRMGTIALSWILALFVIGLQCATLTTPVLIGLFWPGWIAMLLTGLWLSKGVMECFYLKKVGRFMQTGWNWTAFITLLIIYPVYVLGIGFASNFRRYRWKGRTLSSTNTTADERYWSRV
jgi:cellulose synthase/poly-beta-1,6-N-acetylglucosamine synthase-like glycosyltransferase